MRCIAVVEDNPDNRLLLEAMLEDHFQVLEFESGPDALEAIPGSNVELVLMDISLPGMDGVETLERLRKNPKTSHIPAIALTAHAMQGDRERFLSLGFDNYVSKPILDHTVLIELMEELLDRK